MGDDNLEKYKQETVIQRNENHDPNTVYLKGIGQPTKKYLPY